MSVTVGLKPKLQLGVLVERSVASEVLVKDRSNTLEALVTTVS
jgi:hypothetical protein